MKRDGKRRRSSPGQGGLKERNITKSRREFVNESLLNDNERIVSVYVHVVFI